MNVDIKIERSVEIDASMAQLRGLFEDLEGSLRRFPKLRRLTALGNHSYLWEMSTIGSKAANIAHDVVYAAKYQVEPAKYRLKWTAVPGKGNASLDGEMWAQAGDGSARLSFAVRGRLRNVPVPLMYRLLAPAFIQGKFTRLVDTFLEDTRDAILAVRA